MARVTDVQHDTQQRTIQVAVASLRAPKLGAVRQALSDIGPLLDPAAVFEVIGVDVPSGVHHTPCSPDESMAGALNRANALAELACQQHESWSYFVGLEGGLDIIRESISGRETRFAFLENWVYVADRSGVGAFGRSGAVQLPESLAAEVLDRGVELSVAIDAMTGEKGIRDAQGAWGVLTKNLITRQDGFQVAVIAAFARFFNPAAYSPTS